MELLSIEQVIALHEDIIRVTGGALGIRDEGALISSVNQPLMSYGGVDLYPSIVDKSVAMGYFLIANHPFLDGNKRIGHYAMVVNLEVNRFEIIADIDEQERIILDVAAGKLGREDFLQWVSEHLEELKR